MTKLMKMMERKYRYIAGLENGSEKNLGFLGFFKPKNLKSPKFSFFFYFLVKFYTNNIKFHISIFI